MQGIQDKAVVLSQVLEERKINPDETLYIGNDVNDLGCFDLVAYAAAPADAEEEVKRRADLVLQRKGGAGAVREICDMILARQN